MTSTRSTFHVAPSKKRLIKIITEKGASAVLTGWETTDEEAIQFIMNQPGKEFLALGCDNHDERGACLGHPVDEEKS